MKNIFCLYFIIVINSVQSAHASDVNLDQLAKNYFNAWTATQSPKATKDDLEKYLSLLTDDIGHQHLPYDPDDSRTPIGKSNMRKGMSYYLGAHTEYQATLVNFVTGHDIIVIKYETHSKGIHPQTKKQIESKHMTLETLEIENGKVSVIRKYSK